VDDGQGIAEGVADERGVSLGEVRGSVTVLDVEGVWWRRAPGHGPLSTAATEDSHTAITVLRDSGGHIRRRRSAWHDGEHPRSFIRGG
jgi:hypothetical protein